MSPTKNIFFPTLPADLWAIPLRQKKHLGKFESINASDQLSNEKI